jgi:hypothetical protein
MPDDSGRQSGWYAVGAALTAAGCALFPLGLTTTPRSHTLQFLGLIAFVAGLAVIICAMIGRRPPATSGPTRFQSITVVASLLVIGVGGFAIFNQGQPGPSQPTITSASRTPSATPTIGSSNTSSSPTQGAQWGPGTIRITTSQGADLDTVPPTISNDSKNNDIILILLPPGYRSNYRIVPIKNSALWTRVGIPDGSDCAVLIRTQGLGSHAPLEVNPGSAICMQTGQGKIATVIVQRLVDSACYLKVIVWNVPHQ